VQNQCEYVVISGEKNFGVELVGGRYGVGLVLEMDFSNHLGRSHRLDDLVTFMGVVA
jgi:hypothetical protein